MLLVSDRASEFWLVRGNRLFDPGKSVRASELDLEGRLFVPGKSVRADEFRLVRGVRVLDSGLFGRKPVGEPHLNRVDWALAV